MCVCVCLPPMFSVVRACAPYSGTRKGHTAVSLFHVLLFAVGICSLNQNAPIRLKYLALLASKAGHFNLESAYAKFHMRLSTRLYVRTSKPYLLVWHELYSPDVRGEGLLREAFLVGIRSHERRRFLTN